MVIVLQRVHWVFFGATLQHVTRHLADPSEISSLRGGAQAGRQTNLRKLTKYQTDTSPTDNLITMMLLVVGMMLLVSSQAFTIPTPLATMRPHLSAKSHRQHQRSTALSGLFGGKKTEDPSPNNSSDAPLPNRIIEIPVSSLKKGVLRFTLGLYLIGLQNTPDTGSWTANQASDTALDMYFRDGSAKFSVVSEDSAIAVDRYGQPSLPYLLQESVILHCVLDEIRTLAFDETIEKENRLLQFIDESGDAIEKARAVLPARQARA